MDAVLQALADPSRRTVLEILRHHPATAGELADALPIARPGVSRHLRVLREAGLVEVRHEAQRRIYTLRPEALVEVDEWLEDYRALWQNRLDALHTEIARGKKDGHEITGDNAGARRHPRSGARRGRVRHRHRRPVGGVHHTRSLGALDRPGVRRPARGRDGHAVFTSTWTGPARIEVCDAPHHLLFTSEPGTDEESQIEAWLTAEGSRTRLVVEERGLPVDQLHFYGAGWQVHLEDLGRVAGRRRPRPRRRLVGAGAGPGAGTPAGPSSPPRAGTPPTEVSLTDCSSRPAGPV